MMPATLDACPLRVEDAPGDLPLEPDNRRVRTRRDKSANESPELTAEIARELLRYDSATGLLYWKPRDRKWFLSDGSWCMWNTRFAGQQITAKSDGYYLVRIFDRLYKAHRVIWLIAYGHFPMGQVDHINGTRSDNRLENMRDVPGRMNQQNMRAARKDNKSCGLLGVSYDKRKKSASAPWLSKIGVDGKTINLGSFKDPESAHEAYLKAKRDKHALCTI